MAKEDNVSPIQFISGDGQFNVSGMENFSQKMKLDEHGLSYAVVAIIGPQGSGKSTVLNHLFGTNFVEMNATIKRSQTTQGIWIAKAVDIDPCTIIFDVEGTDGEEREDAVTFEKQSALFALAMSDVLVINLWYHDIGREQAGCRPLLKTVFQVMTRLIIPRKRTLLFVIRDKSEATTLEHLTKQVQKGVEKIYDSVSKPETRKETQLSSLFDVRVAALPHYEHRRAEFEKEVVSLRQCFMNSTTSGGIAGDQQDKIPASEISCSAQKIWEQIKEDKDLDLPAHKILLGTVRCEKILEDRFADFVGSEDWCKLEYDLKSGPVKDFGTNVTRSIYMCLSRYDEEALCFDERIRDAKRHVLREKLLQLVQPAYQSMLAHLHAAALSNFQKALNKALESGEHFPTAIQSCRDHFQSAFCEGCKAAAIEQANWDSSNVLHKLQSDINDQINLAQARAAAQAAAAQAAAVQAAAAQAAAAANEQARIRRYRRFLTIPLQIGATVLNLAGSLMGGGGGLMGQWD